MYIYIFLLLLEKLTIKFCVGAENAASANTVQIRF